MSDDSDRKFDPTPQRREKMRKEGKFARARDAAPAASALAALAAFAGSFDAITEQIRALFAATTGDVGALTRGDLSGARAAAITALGTLIGPPLIAACLAGSLVAAAQAGFRVETSLVGFKMDRLDPIGRIKQMFGAKRALTELLLALAKVGVVGAVSFSAFREAVPSLVGLAHQTTEEAAHTIGQIVSTLAIRALVATLIVAAADYAQSYFSVAREMKMTFREMRDEMRSEDGDPHLKAKIRARARALARKRGSIDLRQAAVVVTNPTHVAVALRYEPSDPAPIVVAKGHDEFALAIRKEARGYGIPIVENRRLARTLDAEIGIGKPIRVEHFAAVAKVLAFVFRLGKGKRARARSAPAAKGPRAAAPRAAHA
ncbi:MAG: EscU/YscU/HrcU family type III secretion system export apparatus switch protein [Polyangiaceae bacterium]